MRMLLLGVLLAAPCFSSPAAAERECRPASPAEPPHEDPSFITTAYFCDGAMKVRRRVETFVRTGTPSNETVYDSEGRRIRYRIWNSEHEQTGELGFEHLADGTYVKTDFGPNGRDVRQRELYRPRPGKDALLRRWYYSDEKDKTRPPELTHSDLYAEDAGKERILERRLYGESGAETRRAAFEYAPGAPAGARPSAFKVFDAEGNVVRSYSYERSLEEALDLRSIYRAHGESEEEIERRLARVEAPGKIAVAVLDSGFDVFNPHVADRMWRNPSASAEAVDEMCRSVMGWDRERQRPLPLDRIEIPREPGVPVSHGTHTGTIAVGELDYAALLGFAGDFTDPAYLGRIARFLKKHDIRFANMSFAMSDDGPFAGNPKAIDAISQLIASNPQTLFAAAAGNEYADLDEGFHMFPANFSYRNLIVVGSIDAAELDEGRLSEYQISDFSNRGKGSVDILAPGKDVWAADMGGGIIRHTGTSMASPMLLRLGALPLAHAHPGLGAAEIKELLIKTAYIPSLKKPFPVRSGGIVFPSRALAAAALLERDPSLGVEGAAVAARADPSLVKPGEGSYPEYIERLRAFWRARGL